MKYTQYLLVILTILSINNLCFAQGNIVDYFLKDPKAWDDTKTIIHKSPKKIVIVDGIEGLGFNLAELSEGDEVAFDIFGN